MSDFIEAASPILTHFPMSSQSNKQLIKLSLELGNHLFGLTLVEIFPKLMSKLYRMDIRVCSAHPSRTTCIQAAPEPFLCALTSIHPEIWQSVPRESGLRSKFAPVVKLYRKRAMTDCSNVPVLFDIKQIY